LQLSARNSGIAKSVAASTKSRQHEPRSGGMLQIT
jgi:hypothetical protein